MTQKKPDTSPAALRELLESKGINPAEPDRIWQFIKALTSEPPQTPSIEDSQSAATFLYELILAASEGEDWNKYKKRGGIPRKPSNKRFDPKLVKVDDSDFNVVMQYALDRIKHKDACKIIMDRHHIGQRAAESAIAEIKPRAEKHIAFWSLS